MAGIPRSRNNHGPRTWLWASTVLIFIWPRAVDSGGMVEHNVSLQCPHANITAPACSNNSTLFAYLNKSKHNKDVSLDNCATCVCAEPQNDQWEILNRASRGESNTFERSWGRCCENWNGTACDVCMDVSACPPKEIDGVLYSPINCSAGQVWPQWEELQDGKRYSCTPCGFGTDDPDCVYTDLPGASFDVVAFDGWAEVAMRVGRYTSGGTDWGEHFYHQNWYEYAAMFIGQLNDCKHSRGPCNWDSNVDCITMDCSSTDIQCPPDNLPYCPGYTYDPCSHKYVCDGECDSRTKVGKCCIDRDGDDDDEYNGHRFHITQPFCCSGSGGTCESPEVFWNDVRTTFSCEIEAVDGMAPGTRICYLNQEHTNNPAGFPYTCHVGNCIYNASGRVIPVDDDSSLEPQPHVSLQILLVQIATGVLCAAILMTYLTGQLRRRAQKIRSPEDGFEFFKSDASTYSLIPDGEEEASRQEGDEGVDPLGLPDIEASDAVSSGAFCAPPPEAALGALTWSSVRVHCGHFDALRGVSGAARRGAVSAVLGPSGAGKSSLLRALGGRLVTDSVAHGTVRLGAEALHAAHRRATMAFVPQDDAALPEALTVKEHLLFHATLRRHSLVRHRYANGSRNASSMRLAHRTDAEDAVRSVVAALDLGRCASRLIGQRPDDDDAGADGVRGISGGEARRVSVAAELLGEPSVVLLDEPTSRLDASAALALAVSLRRVARGGALSSTLATKRQRQEPVTTSVSNNGALTYPVVLTSLHQPRAEIFYEALDSIYLLARGRLVWAGDVEQATKLAKNRRNLLDARCEATGTLLPFEDGAVAPWPIELNPADVLIDAIDEAVSTLGVRDTYGQDNDEEASQFRKAVDTALQLSHQSDDDEASEEGGFCVHEPFQAATNSPVPCHFDWAPAPVTTQLRTLLERQLIRAARAPSLLLLHAGGSLAAALCLGSIDNDPPRDLGGAQRRIEAIFFALFFLALLALTAISSFRDDAVVANYERAALGGLYGPFAHFASVVLVDTIALRLLPALVFASVAYPLGGFRDRCAGLCVIRFVVSLSLTSIASGFAALALGSCVANATAANAIGSLGVLAMAIFGGVAVDVNSGTSNNKVSGDSASHRFSRSVVQFAAKCDALYYAFRAAVIGEFAGAKDSNGFPVEYVIDAHKCDNSFKPVAVDVDAILVTLDLPTTPSKADEALICLVFVMLVWLGIAIVAHYLCSGPRFGVDAKRGNETSRVFWWIRTTSEMTNVQPGLLAEHQTENSLGNARESMTLRCCGCMGPAGVEITAASSGPVNQLYPDDNNISDQLVQGLLPEAARAPHNGYDDDGDSDDDARDLLHGSMSDGSSLALCSPEVACQNLTLRVTEWRTTSASCFTSRKALNILDHCFFAAKPAAVTALLGPSGAGKSSLLDVLAGRRTTGSLDASSVVNIDGIGTTAAERRRLSRYAPQDDILPPRLTAAEHLAFHGRLRLPRSWSDGRKVRAAAREARRLGLTLANEFNASKVLLSRASGGQRRRITLATELIAKTRLFFCDEPTTGTIDFNPSVMSVSLTTGLDAATALLTCRRLRRVSRRGVTVVAVLHQPRPEIFFDFDVVALVVKGRVAFVGSPHAAATKFLGKPNSDVPNLITINPADCMLDAVTSAVMMADKHARSRSLSGRQTSVRQPALASDHLTEELAEEEKKMDQNLNEGAAGHDGQNYAASDLDNASGDRYTINGPSLEPVNTLPVDPVGTATFSGGTLSQHRSWSTQVAYSALWQDAPSTWDMFRLLAKREARAVSRDYTSLALHFLPAVAVGLLLGVVYEDLPSKDDTAAGIMDRYGLAFIVVTTVGLLALSAAPRSRRAARLFSRERDALRDSAFPSFAAAAYVGDALPLRLVPPAVLAFVAALLSKCCQTNWHMFGFVAAATQLHYALAAVGRVIGAVAPRDGVCSGCSALVLLFSLLLCGFFVSPKDLPNPPWKQIARIFPASYAYEALNAHMFADVDTLFIVSKVGGANVKEGPFTGTTILNCFGLDNAHKAPAKHIVLGIFGVIADALTLLAFKLFARERR